MSYDSEVGAPAPTTNDDLVWGTLVNTGAVTGGPFVVGETVVESGSGLWIGRVLAVDTTNTSLVVDIETGTVGNAEAILGGTSGATATTSSAPTGLEIQSGGGVFALYALDDLGTTGFIYGQQTKGLAPVNDARLYAATDHTDYYEVNGTPIERAIATPFVGISTGSALIGSYGLGLEASDTAAADTYFDLSNTAITPPNNVTFTVSGFISGDYVLCTEDNAGDINFTQMVSDTSATSATQTAISVVSIPSDTPTSAGTKGGIRVERDNGLYSLHRYTSWDSGTNDFTIPSSDFSTNQATTPFNVFVTYLDLVTAATSETFSYVYDSDRTHFVRVRDGGVTPIKTAETTGVMGNTGGTASVNRIADA